jgi:thiamine biosynthesis protein ThiS
MKLTLNGAEREFETPADGKTHVAWLVAELGLRPEIVAIEVNAQLVPRATYADVTLSEGDQVECVTLVGGG